MNVLGNYAHPLEGSDQIEFDDIYELLSGLNWSFFSLLYLWGSFKHEFKFNFLNPENFMYNWLLTIMIMKIGRTNRRLWGVVDERILEEGKF